MKKLVMLVLSLLILFVIVPIEQSEAQIPERFKSKMDQSTSEEISLEVAKSIKIIPEYKLDVSKIPDLEESIVDKVEQPTGSTVQNKVKSINNVLNNYRRSPVRFKSYTIDFSLTTPYNTSYRRLDINTSTYDDPY